MHHQALLRRAPQHPHRVVVGLPEDVHVSVKYEDDQNGGHTDPEHQVVLVDERKDVGADRVELLAVPAQQRQHGDDNGDRPHHAEGDHGFSARHNAPVRQRAVDRNVSIDGGEEQASHRRGERGRHAPQLEQKHVGTVFAVKDVKVQEAVDKDDAAKQVCDGQAAYEMVGGPAAQGT